MRFFLELLYTGTSCAEPELTSAMGAYELAHRWAVGSILPIAERLLITLLTVESFEPIVEVAILKGSPELEEAIAKWGVASAGVQATLKAGGYSPALRALLGFAPQPQERPGRKRKSF